MIDDIRRTAPRIEKKTNEKEQAFQAVFQDPIKVKRAEASLIEKIWKISLTVLLLFIIGGFGWRSIYNNEKGREKSEVQDIQTDEIVDSTLFDPQAFYSAVLSDGKVYFGKVRGANAEHYIMEAVFYERGGNEGISTTTSDRVQGSEKKLVLVKLGTEAYQPEDVVYVQKSKVLSISPLKEDSAVVKAIRGYLDKAE